MPRRSAPPPVADDAPDIRHEAEAAKALGVSVQSLRQWRREGLIRFVGRARLDVTAVRQALIDAGKLPGERGRLASVPGEGMTRAEAERRRMVAQAELSELRLATQRGALIDRRMAEDKTMALASQLRDSWRTWPLDDAEVIAHDLGVQDVSLVRRVLEARVTARLQGLRDVVARLAP